MELVFADNVAGVDSKTGTAITQVDIKEGDVLIPLVNTKGEITDFKRLFTIADKDSVSKNINKELFYEEYKN